MVILPVVLLFLGGLLLTPAPQLVADILDNYTSALWLAYVARPAPTGPAPVTSLSLYAPFVLAPPPPPPQPAKPPFLAPPPAPLAFAHIALCETAPGHVSGPHEIPQRDAVAQRTLDAAALWMAVALGSAILGAASAASSKAAACEEPIAIQSDEVPEFFIITQNSVAEEMVDLIYSSNETSPISSPVLDPADPEQIVEDHVIDEIPTTDNAGAHVLGTIWFHRLTDAADENVDDEQFIYPDADSAAEDDYVPGIDADDEQFVYPDSDSAAEDHCAPGAALAGAASEEATSTARRDDDTADVDVHPSADNAHSSGLEASVCAPGNKAPLSVVQRAPDADPGSDASVAVPAPDAIPTQEATLHGSTSAPRPSSMPPAHDEEPTRGAALAELAHAYMPSCPQASIWDQNANTSAPNTSPPFSVCAKTRRSRRKGKGGAAQAPLAPNVVGYAAASPCVRLAEPEPAALARGPVMEDVESRPRTSRRRRDVRSLSPSPASARSAPRMPMAELALPAGLYERAWGLDR